MKNKKEKASSSPELLEKPIFSDRKNVVRLIVFIVAFAVAVGSITFGISRIIHKDPGLYEITVDTISDLPFYASGIRLNYYFDGSSNEIKAHLATVKSIYTSALKQSYQWFDAENTYLETANLAQINQETGTPVKLHEDLFDILQDALERNNRSESYSIFASPLLNLSKDLLYANNPVPVDPENEEGTRILMEKLEQVIFDHPGTLLLNEDDLTATLTLSEEYQALIEEYGLEDYGVLNLGVLADAYRLSYIAKMLETRGYTRGYLTTDSGLTLLLSSYESNAAYCLYSLEEDGTVVLSATKATSFGNAACAFRIFALSAENESGFYSFEKGKKTLYRNPYQIAFPDEQPLLSALVLAKGNEIVDATYTCVCLMAAKDGSAALEIAKSSGLDWIMDLNDGEAKLYLSNAQGVETVARYQTILP